MGLLLLNMQHQIQLITDKIHPVSKQTCKSNDFQIFIN